MAASHGNVRLHKLETPPHVPAELVRDFDMSDCVPEDGNIHRYWKEEVQDRGPDIFWTPHNGGHWVVTRAKDFDVVMNQPDMYSNAEFAIPPGVVPKLIPLQLDPPEHTRYRRLLMPFFVPRALNEIEAKARSVAISLIEKLKPRGECEFVSEFAGTMPVIAFLTMMQLPEEDLKMLRDLSADATKIHDPEKSAAAWSELSDYIRYWIEDRRKNPGDDPLSATVHGKVNDRPLSADEVFSMNLLLLGGGLDTVASMMSFFALYLANDKRCQQRIREDENIIPAVVQELARRFGISNLARIVARDTELNGISFKKGDMVLIPMSLYGLDDRFHSDPLNVDLDRKDVKHTAWGQGNHACIGQVLAQRELAVFLQEWTRHIPEFSVKKGTRPVRSCSLINSVDELYLSW